MEDLKVPEVDEVDRESLVKEIELIRRTLGGISNVAQNSHVTSEYDVEEDESIAREFEDSEDELAIIKSPGYREPDADEILQNKEIPVVVLSGESEEEGGVKKSGRAATTDVLTENEKNCHYSQELSEGVSYRISSVLPRDNADEVELILTPVIPNAGESLEQPDSVWAEEPGDDYSLTELQPASTTLDLATHELHEDVWWSPAPRVNLDMEFPGYDLWAEKRKSAQTVAEDKEVENLMQSENGFDIVDFAGEKTDVHRCLKLNRRYQTVIENELRRIERSLMENREVQLGFTQVTQSSLTRAEALAFKQLATFSAPYFRDRAKECPPDNEDTKLRQDIGQPSAFAKPARPWTKEEMKILCDAVKSEVLRAKLTPLLQRTEMLLPKKSKTEAEEKEIEELKSKVEQLKSLPLGMLVQDCTVTIDWEDIALKMLPSRTPFQCEICWYNELHPLLNKDQWTKEEDKKLLKLAKENNKEDWSKIALELQTNRSPVQCLRRFQKSLHKGFLKSKWDKEEDKKLLEAVKICGVGAWEQVSHLLEGRTGSQCMHRYMKSVNPDIKRGKWDAEEDKLLRKAVEKFGSNWAKIRTLIPHRTDTQIRERWSDVLDPSLNKGQWTKEEDERLLKIVEEHGREKWGKIASQLGGRSDNRCWRRWRQLKKDDPELQSQIATAQRKKAVFVTNFAGRPKDRPSIGPEDLDISEHPDIPVKARTQRSKTSGAAPMAPTNITRSSTEKRRTQVLPRAPRAGAQAQRGTKRVQNPSPISSNVKRAKIKALCAADDSTRNAGSTNASTATTRNTPMTSPNSTRVNTPVPSQQQTKNKLTAPSPAVVSQASALPNALPMAYLTQFSVLLQAFSVDVSGVLKNVHSPRPTEPSESHTITQNEQNNTAQGGTTMNDSDSMQSDTALSRSAPQAKAAKPSQNASGNCGTPKSQDHNGQLEIIHNADGSDIQKHATSNDGPKESNIGVCDSCASLKICDVVDVLDNDRSNGSKRDVREMHVAEALLSINGSKAESSRSSSFNAVGHRSTQNPQHHKGQRRLNQGADSSDVQKEAPSGDKTKGSNVGVRDNLAAPNVPNFLDVQNDDGSNRDVSQIHVAEALLSINRLEAESTQSISFQEVKGHDESSQTCRNIWGDRSAQKTQDHEKQRRLDKGAVGVSVQRKAPKNYRSNETDVVEVSDSSAAKKVLETVDMLDSDGPNASNRDVGEVLIPRASRGKFSPKKTLTFGGEQRNTRLSTRIRNAASKRAVNEDGSKGTQRNRIATPTVGDETGMAKDKTDRVGGGVGTISHEIEKVGEVSEGRQDLERRRTRSEKTSEATSVEGVVLSDSRHGLAHDIVMMNPSNDETPEKTLAVKRRRGRHRKNRGTNEAQNDNKRRKTVSGGSENAQETDCSNSGNSTYSIVGDVENRSKPAELGTSGIAEVRMAEANKTNRALRRRYSAHTRCRHRAIDNTVSSTACVPVEKPAKKKPDKKSSLNTKRRGRKSRYPMRRENEDEHACQFCDDPEAEAENAATVKHAAVADQPRVPLVPPIPPSSTTLNAFKSLLMSRKHLQAQAKRLRPGDEQATSCTQSADGVNEADLRPSEEGTVGTGVKNPLADRLLVDVGEEPTKKFSNSLAYQQLVNRFTGLFLWPGFLSIVNPEYCNTNMSSVSTATGNSVTTPSSP